MDTTNIKIKLIKEIDSLDNKNVKELYGIVMNFINGKVESENWDNLTEIQKAGIELGINQLDQNKGLDHDMVMEELKKKYGI
ncbi:hypothetical protein SAMN05444280_105127 [Tangfeifania diversioriginum]|uniref:Addiction module component n=1 Tax=Tangfeifania diversioriginum TaxID=1168035 RepID=A0A1M6DNN4_9BACT|nr:hypothetical protein [Tangfeifania diversioriginum]SHI74856.1 hypothetical protein SAMN05444280_105127 [Tangfeifania diversioriginum]